MTNQCAARPEFVVHKWILYCLGSLRTLTGSSHKEIKWNALTWLNSQWRSLKTKRYTNFWGAKEQIVCH